MEKDLVLFTTHFPFQGGETFLYHEFPFLCNKFRKVTIVPMETPKGNPQIEIPGNVEIYNFNTRAQKPLKPIAIKYGWLILKWYLKEFIYSPHRFKYITQFKWNLHRLLGIAMWADECPEEWNRPDVTLYTYWFNEWTSALALLKEKGWKSTLVTRAHGYDFDEAQQARGYHPFRYTEINSVNQIYQISEFGLKYMKRQFGNRAHTSLAYLGVNVQSSIAPINQSDVMIFVSCSNFVPLKRLHLIAEILKHLDQPFRWIHFGSGTGMEDVVARCKQILPQEKMDFRGWTANNKLMEFYQQNGVDLFLNTSILEGLPVSLMEAMSFGIPMLGCNICGVPEIVNEETGILMEPEFDPQKAAEIIAQKMKSSFRNPEYRKNIQNQFSNKFRADINFMKFAETLSNQTN